MMDDKFSLKDPSMNSIHDDFTNLKQFNLLFLALSTCYWIYGFCLLVVVPYTDATKFNPDWETLAVIVFGLYFILMNFLFL